jgi:uncharacterized membrane protein
VRLRARTAITNHQAIVVIDAFVAWLWVRYLAAAMIAPTQSAHHHRIQALLQPRQQLATVPVASVP